MLAQQTMLATLVVGSAQQLSVKAHWHWSNNKKTVRIYSPNSPSAHTTITQEIIQNADDAEASTVHFYLDNRSHGTNSLVYPSLAQFQGPALLSYNDAVFKEKDWQSIQDMQQSVKADDPFKVGKFGIGFNSVYHITGKTY